MREALAALVTYYNWQRVALLHDDSVWGSDSGAAFRAAFLGQAENGDLITRWGQGNGTHGAKIALAQCRLAKARLHSLQQPLFQELVI